MRFRTNGKPTIIATIMQEGDNGTDDVLRFTDRFGLSICLGKWSSEHIKRSHPEAVQHRKLIETALSDPDQIRQEVKTGRRQYIHFVTDGRFAGKHFLVYVKVVREGPFPSWLFSRRVGYVSTAHFAKTGKIKKGTMSGRWSVTYEKRKPAG